MAEKFYIADEELGGIEREYVESEGKKAEVGDYVHVFGHVVNVANGVFKVSSSYGGGNVINYYVSNTEFSTPYSDGKYYATLSPTENVRINGEVFRMVDRKAEVGDKVINTVDREISIVSRMDVRDDNYIEITDEDRSYFGGLFDGEYYVIEPVDSEESPQSVADLLTNLAQEVVKLRKQVEALSERVESNRDDTVTFAEEFTAFKKEQEFANELFESDIILLDERTQPEELAETVLGNITIRRSMYGDY